MILWKKITTINKYLDIAFGEKYVVSLWLSKLTSHSIIYTSVLVNPKRGGKVCSYSLKIFLSSINIYSNSLLKILKYWSHPKVLNQICILIHISIYIICIRIHINLRSSSWKHQILNSLLSPCFTEFCL